LCNQLNFIFCSTENIYLVLSEDRIISLDTFPILKAWEFPFLENFAAIPASSGKGLPTLPQSLNFLPKLAAQAAKSKAFAACAARKTAKQTPHYKPVL
jgi:hypothetical protein